MGSRSRKRKKKPSRDRPPARPRWPWLLVLAAGAAAGSWLLPPRHQAMAEGAFEGQNLLGQSLRPYLNGEAYEAPPSYFEALNPHLTRDWAPLRGVVEDGRKLISLPIPELYDLERDSTERNNIYKDEPAVAQRMERTLAILTGDEVAVEVERPDPETVERLLALGYLTAPAAERRTDYSLDDDPKRLVDVSNAYDEVAELFAEGKFPESLPVLEGILERQPRSSEAYRGLAYAFHQMGRIDEAIAVLERAVANGLQDTSLLGTLSAYLLDAGAVEMAVGLLEDLTRREPDYAEGHNQLGIAYGRVGRFDEAERESSSASWSSTRAPPPSTTIWAGSRCRAETWTRRSA